MGTPVQIGPWNKGLNTADSEGSLDPDELVICQNVRLDPDGNPRKRPGFGGYGTVQNKVNGDNPVNLLVRFYKGDGTKQLIAAAGGKLRKGDDTNGTWTDIPIDGSGANSMHTSNLCDYIVYKDRLYITDGLRVQRYDGVNNLYAGHFVHNSAGWTLTPGTGGLLTPSSTYKYKMTSVQGDLGEGPASAERSVATGPGQNRITLTTLDSAPGGYGATAKKLYRTIANGNLFKLVATLGPGDTSYVDDIADSALGADLVNVHAPRDDSRFVILGHDERAYWFGRTGINASIVEASDVGFPDRVPDNTFFAVSNNDGDALTGAGKVPGGIVFFKRNSMWLLRAFGFGLINVSSKIGTVAPFSVVEVPGGLVFLAQNRRVYHFDGTNLKEMGRKIGPEFLGITTAALNRIASVYHDDRYILSYDKRGLKGYNDRRVEFDLVGGKWEGPHFNKDVTNKDLLTASYFSAWDSQLDRGELYWGEGRGASGSYVYGQTEFTIADMGNRFQSKIRTGKLPLEGLKEKKVFKVFADGRWDGTLTATLLGEDVTLAAIVDLNLAVPSNALIWGQGNWGEKNWGGATQQVAEGPLNAQARQRKPQLDLDDKATSATFFLERIEMLVEALPLK